ncbi:ubinuclein-1-like isoform X2 [Conger conger]|uniref:ubinuclein-1-like isoform X2 n=1 Tax=Conger conger TaxID=82655 RepID=UPI002A5AB32D|nr:ubinuclein-1-like isoform X2 [Conger conger]
MAEPRRVQLTSLSGNIPIPSTLLKLPLKEELTITTSGNDVHTAISEKSETTSRIVLALFEPDQRRCPEFYYPELVKKKSSSLKKPIKSLEEVEEEKHREEAEALAKRFEEKYGGNKRKKDRMQDLIDMGYGYDETDSFIDNSEAYDELVPASLTTKYGGFYINSGMLQFRQASESEADDFTDEMKKIKAPKKKKLKDGGDVKLIKKKTKDGQHKKSKVSKMGIMPLNSTEEKKKKKKHSGALSVNEMLKTFQREKESSLTEPKPPQISQPMTLSVREMDPSLSVADPLLSLIGSANESDFFQAASTIDFDIDLDKLLYESPEPSPPGLDENSDPLSAVQSQKQPLSLPEGLPPALERRIKELTQAAKASEGEGKQKFFTQDINNMLLDIELQSRELNSQMRSGIYAHLASFLPCSKDTLVKRAKKLHLHEQDGRLKEPLQRLKEAIGRSMPGQISKYQDECQAHTQAKFAKILEEGKEKESKDKAYSDDDDEEEKSGKRVMGPRKKFQWNDEIREFLCNVVRLKMGSYELERNKSQNAEEYLKAFLEAEVKPLWPKGWMQARMLFKESRRAHCHITCLPTKKKVITAPKIKNKEPFVKLERKGTFFGNAPTPTGSTVLGSGSPSVLASGSESSSVGPHGCCGPHCAPVHAPNSIQAFSMDDSLDGDLLHNPPSLGAVSEELAALNSDARGSPDFCFSAVHKPAPDSVPASALLEERNAVPKLSETTSMATSQSPLNLLAEQALALGQLSQDGKTENTQLLILPGYKELLSHATLSAKALSDSMQAKERSFNQPGTSHSPLPSPTLKPFLQHSQRQKHFPTPMQYNLGSSQNKASKYFHPCSGVQQPKAASKAQAFQSLSSSPPNNGHPASISIASMIPSKGSALTYLPKHGSTPSPSGLAFKPEFSLPGTPQGSAAQCLSGSHGPATGAKSPSPSQAPCLQSPSTTVKKAPSSQKLTLVAPPGGSNGDSAMGIQGVARLLTSSLNPAVAPPVSAPVAAVTKSGASVLSSAPSLNLLSPSFTTAGQKLTPGTLGILPGIVPMHTFSFPVIFNPESASQKMGSKDAIVTGPAPGTFHHGLTHSIFGGLHSSTLHPPQLPQSTLSSHLQQSLQDGSKVHGESANAQRKLQ